MYSNRFRARTWAADLIRDVLYGLRQHVRRPGFATVSILTLGLGVGATTAIFSVVNGVILKPLPFTQPERLVGVHHQGYGQGPGTYFTYRDQNRTFEAVGAWEGNEVSIAGGGEPERVEALAVTAGTLPLLGVKPARGRLFTREDDAPGSPLRAVLTHGYWRRAHGGDPGVVGRTVRIDGEMAEVIGVLPESFSFLRRHPAVVLPMRLDPADQSAFDFAAVARLKPGITLAQANADLARMIPLLPAQYAAFELRPDVRPLVRDVIDEVDRPLWILLGTVAIVFLIACANVANLFLVRAESRQQELAVRAALGAGRGRVARQLISEALVLALGGGLVGLLLARAGTSLLRRIAPAELPRVEEIGIDPAVLLFTLAVSLLAGICCGLVPVARLGKDDASRLREGGRAASDGPGRHRLRGRLVVAEVALTVMLLIASGLMIRTFVAMRQVQPGFTAPRQVQTFQVPLPLETGDPAAVARTYQEISRRIEAIPGVTSVGFASSVTMDGEDNTNPLYVEGVATPAGELPPLRRFKAAGPGYFETMGNPVVAGRAISWDDIRQARPVVVISANLARAYWGSAGGALGKRVRNDPAGPWQEVVGVAGDERDDGVDRPVTSIVYWPLMHPSYGSSEMTYAVRSPRAGSPELVRELRQAVRSVNPALPLARVETLEQIRADSMARTSFLMVMLGIAAGVALVLGVVGIYAVISYIAAQRTREVGTRIALGASGGDVRRLFLRHGLMLALAGVGIGIAGALVLTRVISAHLFGVGPTDPVTYAAVALGLTGVALLASYLPARRASRVDPVVTLRAGG
jgi:predicted permease